MMADTKETARFLTLADVRERFGVSRSTVWRWQAERGLKIVKIGGVVRVRESDLREFLERHMPAIPETN